MIRTLYLTALIVLGLLSAELHAKTRFQVTVSEAYINLHTGPGKAYPIFYVGQRGESLTVLKRRGIWYKVEMSTNGKKLVTGWTHRDDLGNTLVVGSGSMSSEHPWMNYAYDPKFSATFMLGRLNGEGESDSIAGILSYSAMPLIDTELHIGQWIGTNKQGWYTNAQLLYMPYRNWWIKPFVSLGYGYLEREARGPNILFEDEDDNFLLAGSGLQIRITSQYQLRLEYRHFNTLTSNDDNSELEQWQIGLSAKF